MTGTTPPTACRSCGGFGSYLINKTTDMEDSVKCWDCGGTGREPQVIDLLGALKASIERARQERRT